MANRFSSAGLGIPLLTCDFEFRCVLQVLITTDLRRGKCLGLQRADIDFQNGALTVNRATTYTPECGITMAQPKTAHSVRTIPVVPSTLIVDLAWAKSLLGI